MVPSVVEVADDRGDGLGHGLGGGRLRGLEPQPLVGELGRVEVDRAPLTPLPPMSMPSWIGHLTSVGATGLPAPRVKGSGRGGQQAVVLAVGGAVLGQLVEVPELALQHPHVPQVQEVDGQQHGRVLARPALEDERVGGDGGHVVVPQPLDRLGRQAGAGVGEAQLVALGQEGHLPGADHEDVAGLDVDRRRGRRPPRGRRR